MIEPRTQIGCILGYESEQVVNSTFEPDRRRMQSTYRRKTRFGTGQTDDGHFAGRFVQNRHVNCGRVCPERGKRQRSAVELFGNRFPLLGIDDDARTRPVSISPGVL
jgi:hypothetical protein